jgi:hypothetical protein
MENGDSENRNNEVDPTFDLQMQKLQKQSKSKARAPLPSKLAATEHEPRPNPNEGDLDDSDAEFAEEMDRANAMADCAAGPLASHGSSHSKEAALESIFLARDCTQTPAYAGLAEFCGNFAAELQKNGACLQATEEWLKSADLPHEVYDSLPNQLALEPAEAHDLSKLMVFRNEDVECALICWQPLQASAMKSHIGHKTLTKILAGSLTEHLYHRPSGRKDSAQSCDNSIRPSVSDVVHDPNVPHTSLPMDEGMTFIRAGRNDIHNLENLSEGQVAMSLHCYSPPFHRLETDQDAHTRCLSKIKHVQIGQTDCMVTDRAESKEWRT